jgi:phage terminase large subunit GpA-like protein
MNTAPDVYQQLARVFRFTEGEKRVFKAKEALTISEHAARYRMVTEGRIVGKWRNEITPYLIGPMDALSLPWVRRVILVFPPQSGKTQVAINFIHYCIDQDPGPAMYVGPDEKLLKRIGKRKLIPSFQCTPRIAAFLSPRSDDTTQTMVRFMNGMDLMMVWASSPAEVSADSIRYMIRDEKDKFPEFSGKEADPDTLTEVRTTAYPYNYKILDISTPNTEIGIWKDMQEEADVIYYYHACCPICGAFQKMEFDNITWPKEQRDPREIRRRKLAHYVCIKCGMKWDDYMRDKAVLDGLKNPDAFCGWVPDREIEKPEVLAFHLQSWYSPFVSISKAAARFLRGQEDPRKLMAFVTQDKAEAWKETVIPKKESGILLLKTAVPPGVVPLGAAALTAGIDSQKFGFWFVVRAWAENLTSWLIQYGFLTTFNDVENLIFNTRYPVWEKDDTMGIWRAAIDTGGGKTDQGESRTEEIYQWLRERSRGAVFGTKGASHHQLKRVQVKIIDKMPRNNKPIPGGLELRLLDTDQFKGLIHWRMERREEESQRFHLHAETGMDYIRQLLAEERRRDRRGKLYWHQLRSDNHYLDCEVLAAACADNEWLPSLKMLASYLKQREEEKKVAPQPRIERENIPRAGINKFKRPGWLDRRR